MASQGRFRACKNPAIFAAPIRPNRMQTMVPVLVNLNRHSYDVEPKAAVHRKSKKVLQALPQPDDLTLQDHNACFHECVCNVRPEDPGS